MNLVSVPRGIVAVAVLPGDTIRRKVGGVSMKVTRKTRHRSGLVTLEGEGAPPFTTQAGTVLILAS